jgi:hypothetical protein
VSNPNYKTLFALSLNDGSEVFIPAVAPTGTESLRNGSSALLPGSFPVVKMVGGREIVYTIWQSGQELGDIDFFDGRNDGYMGEMVLDGNTVPGYQAGDMRFVKFREFSSKVRIVDEGSPVSMAGNTLFFSHWGGVDSARITDRSDTLGGGVLNPIDSIKTPPIIRRITACGTKNASTHWSTCGMTLYLDGKYFPAPGFWVYWNVLDPPTWENKVPQSGAYSEGILPRYTYVAEGVIVVEGNGGDLFVLRHSGVVTSPSPTAQVTITPTPAPIIGDANGDGGVDGLDYVIWLTHYNQSFPGGSTVGDFNGDGTIDGVDYVLWLNHYSG